MPRFPARLFGALFLLLLQACTSIPIEQRADKRAELDRVAEETIAALLEQDDGLQSRLDSSVGYFAAQISSATVAVLGGAQGIGVLVDNRNGDRSYLNVKRFDLGAGLGVRYFRALVVFEDPELFDQVRQGRRFRAAGADIAAGSSGKAAAYYPGEGYALHILTDSGASLAATLRMVNFSVNRDLTDTGVSEIGIPNIGFGIEDGREPGEKRWWDHKLPFMAQKVIDMGYDLPLPYGIKGAFVHVDQEQVLTNLYVGINGSEPIPLDWVEFTNAQSINDTYQAIFDMWLFPFMNVYAILGKIDGHAPVDVLIDGNGFLEELGIDCSRPGNALACNLLQDREFLLPIDAQFEGNNYGLGVTLAGGWNGFFFTLPIVWSYADMKGSDTDGAVLSVNPRAGYVVQMGGAGNLALYLGGSYLDSDLTVDGLFTVPGTDFTFDYIIDQKNKDKWAAVVGANWDISSRWALQAEYTGFTGSREAWMASLTWRF